MPIIPCNKVIGMTNYPKDEESSFKNEKNMSISFFEEIFELTKIRQVYKEQAWEAISSSYSCILLCG